MNRLTFLVAIGLVLGLSQAQKYTTRFDTLDIDNILTNERILKNYIKCILDEGPCTEEGRQLRKHIPDALTTQCDKCTDAQKKFVRKGALHLIQKRPEDWQKITKKFDPEAKYGAGFQEFLKGQ
ncbi:ejaculatory bulb-specific protein 3-like [Rhynchophorus ferrugineus]|uniref:Chemosensory protein n=1 Tax=Rhynchophorus ferrugineus TaxID=354439 RepID=A0A834J058_RHYFE|nr:hypothetical protein GWI33_022719 [Rhynchophorus ferrugineus]